MDAFVKQLHSTYPDINFKKARVFAWSPATKQVRFKSTGNTPADTWAILHELGHALLGHNTYQTDLELLIMEVAAWDKAAQIAPLHGVEINQDHVQDCLDTYRDWLDLRSTCPTCAINCMQQSSRQYQCHNCNTVWEVSPSRFCRPYRQLNRGKKFASSVDATKTTFA